MTDREYLNVVDSSENGGDNSELIEVDGQRMMLEDLLADYGRLAKRAKKLEKDSRKALRRYRRRRRSNPFRPN